MNIRKSLAGPLEFSRGTRLILLITAVLAALGPNGLYLYFAATQPEMNLEAMRNPIALAFMIEAMMLLALFLYYVFRRTGSWGKVVLYLVLAFAGSLAFSFPFFLWRESIEVDHG